MADTIDNLVIEISASADAAVRSIDRLNSAIRPLGGASRTAAHGMKVLESETDKVNSTLQRASKDASSAGKGVKGAGKDMEEAGKAAKKGEAGLSSFLSALKRIAFYRFVRSIIREITDAFKIGITNLYQWSSAVNGTFAKSMDRIATSTLYLKNSLGAMLAPIIEKLTPVIEWIIDRIVEVINWINKLFAALSGSQTYTVAKKVATTWGDAGKTASSSAKKAADDIKRTILGFDEINKLEKQNTYSGSGGSSVGSNGTDYTNMFETKKLDGWMLALSNFIDKFNLGVPAVIAGLLAGVEAVSLAFKKLAELSLGWLKDMAGRTIDIAVSLVRSGWTTIKKWAESFGKAVVSLSVVIAQTAESLWEGLKKSWNSIASRVVKFTVSIAQTALGLWTWLKSSWNSIASRVVKFTVSIAQTASGLWNGLKNSWESISNRIVKFTVSIAQTASGLWQGLKSSWNSIQSRIVKFTVSIAQTASSLWLGFKNSWDSIQSRVVKFTVSIAQTASGLWNGLKKSWNNISQRVVKFTVSIAQTASSLWEGFKTSWNKTISSKVLYFSVAISTLASTLWNGLKKGWNSVSNKVAYFATEISTKASDLWDWLKKNWKKVAIGALGFAIAIATPWGTIATALSGLWANVMASFGGALQFGVIPAIGKYTTGGIGDTNSYSEFKQRQEEIKKFVQDFENGVAQENPTVNATINAQPGTGMSRKSAYGYGGSVLSPDVSNTSATATINAKTAWDSVWGGIKQYLGLNNLSTDVDVGLNKTWGWWGALAALGLEGLWTGVDVNLWSNWGWWGPLSYLGLEDLWTGVEVSLWKMWRGDPISWLGLAALATSVVVSLVAGVTGRATGGVYSNGIWSDIPQYASGTTNAHGSLFLAGEAGPEIVGHVGGRTEVLNKSQLASAMYSAVNAAMQGVTLDANFYGGNVDSDINGESLAEMMEYMRADADAMRTQNDLLRQQNELLRQINAKDFSAEITTYQVNKAQSYANRRAGTTVVPVM